MLVTSESIFHIDDFSKIKYTGIAQTRKNMWRRFQFILIESAIRKKYTW